MLIISNLISVLGTHAVTNAYLNKCENHLARPLTRVIPFSMRVLSKSCENISSDVSFAEDV